MRYWSIMEPSRAGPEAEGGSSWGEGFIVVPGGDHAGCLSLEWEVGASMPTGAIGYEVSSWNDGTAWRKLLPLRGATLKDLNIVYRRSKKKISSKPLRLSSARYVRRKRKGIMEMGFRYERGTIRNYVNGGTWECIRFVYEVGDNLAQRLLRHNFSQSIQK